MAVIDRQDPRESRGDGEPSARPADAVGGVGEPPGQVPAEIRDVSFATAVRGYDRRAVDAYVKRVNRLIAELEVGRSPQAAVRHALDRVGEQTSGVLQRAREVAEEITATALAEAEGTTARARAEAEEILEDARMEAHQARGRSKEEAEAILAKARADAAEGARRSQEQLRALQDQAEVRLGELRRDTEVVWDARHDLLEDLHRTAGELEALATGAADRQRRPPTREQGSDGGVQLGELVEPAPAASRQDGDEDQR
jgi:DivIVA domain-containing protein